MLFNFVEGRSSCGEDGANPDEEEIEQHKRRTAAKCTAEGIDMNLCIIIMLEVV